MNWFDIYWFGRLLSAWTLFVFAVVNIANTIVRYTQHYDDSVGLWATIKMGIWGTALAGWYYLLFA